MSRASKIMPPISCPTGHPISCIRVVASASRRLFSAPVLGLCILWRPASACGAAPHAHARNAHASLSGGAGGHVSSSFSRPCHATQHSSWRCIGRLPITLCTLSGNVCNESWQRFSSKPGISHILVDATLTGICNGSASLMLLANTLLRDELIGNIPISVNVMWCLAASSTLLETLNRTALI